LLGEGTTDDELEEEIGLPFTGLDEVEEGLPLETIVLVGRLLLGLGDCEFPVGLGLNRVAKEQLQSTP